MKNAFLLSLILSTGCSSNNNNGGTGGTTAGTTGGGGNDLAGCATTDTCGTDDMGVGCGLNTCALAGAMCGPIGDGCGGTIECGNCPSGQSCGSGGVAFECGSVPSCMPRTCADVGADCGPLGDNCGGLIATCGSCPMGSLCGGGGMPSVCSAVTDASNNDMTVNCGRFCGMFGNCTGTTTTISGTVVAGTDPSRGFGDPDPIFNASVYIPTTAVQPFGTKVTCDQCGAEVSGTPLMTVNTGIDGKFTLANVPCGMGINLPIVIQLGRWRRQIVIPDVACCAPLMLDVDQTHLPRNKTQGDIPHIAVSTGNVDALECVLRKMGIEDAEFTRETGTGRVHIYHGNGADAGNNTSGENTLVDSPTLLENYDMVLFPCWGGQNNKTLARQQNVIAYGDKGGRVFATHFSYTWLATVGSVGTPADGVPMGTPPQPQPWVGTANFNVNANSYGTTTMTGFIDQTFPKGMALAAWLAQPAVGASTTAGQMDIAVVRQDTDSVVPPSQRWLYTQAPDPVVPVVHYTFNTPVGVPAAQQCGRVVFSDFHVENTNNVNGDNFPTECGGAALMTPQEKLLEFMLFDLASCVTPDSAPVICTAQTCMQLGAECGPQADGCGGIIQCGDCPPGQTCGAGGPNKCGATPCNPVTCAAVGAECGIIGDGCGNTVDCGNCPPDKSCGGEGVANKCGGVG